MINIREINDSKLKSTICRNVLEDLIDWFEVKTAREDYILESEKRLFFAAYDEEKPVGFLFLRKTGNKTVELALIGILKKYHRNGIGKMLFEEAKNKSRKLGFEFMQVKTVKMGIYEEYDKTNQFYLNIGFKEFEVIESIWNKENPCQIYIMKI